MNNQMEKLKKDMNKKKLTFIGHRGSGASTYLRKLNRPILANDNSHEAFLINKDKNVIIAETDVRYFPRNKYENRLLITHDKVLNSKGLKMTNLNDYDIKFNVELKRSLKKHVKKYVNQVLSEINLEKVEFFSTFDHNIYKELIENSQEVFYIFDEASYNKFIKYSQELNIKNIVFDSKLFDKMKSTLKNYSKVYMYGLEVNNLENIIKYSEYVTGLIVDDLDVKEKYEEITKTNEK